MRELAPSAVYAIATPERIQAACRGDRPSERLTDRKRWVTARRLFLKAGELGLDVAILFADARHCERLVYWAVLRELDIDDGGTRYRFARRREIAGHATQELVLARTHHPIAEGFIRSYAICETPPFVLEEMSRWQAETAPELHGLDGEERQAMVAHRSLERRLYGRKLAEATRNEQGALRCQVPGCGFDFEATYGELGRGYAEVHHLGGTAENLAALIVVCANCHAMIHRGGEARDPAKLLAVQSGRARARR